MKSPELRTAQPRPKVISSYTKKSYIQLKSEAKILLPF